MQKEFAMCLKRNQDIGLAELCTILFSRYFFKWLFCVPCMKRTKILATVGPASSDPRTIKEMLDAGANAFRINMSHGDHTQWEQLINTIRSITKDAPIIMDTEGPELRLVNVAGEIRLIAGEEFIFATAEYPALPYTSHPITLREGQIVLFDDGAVSVIIEKVDNNVVTARAHADGVLTNRRKVTVPNSLIDLPILSAEDREDLQFCKQMGVDAIALSFTQTAKDVEACRAVVGPGVMIIAKIENHGGVHHITELIRAADGIMVARGDLGVEIPLEDVPIVQKRIIRACNNTGKPVIVATQMLESMTVASRPTRAEVSDVANAIMDGADCVMLSGETARGKYPVETVRTMARIAERIDPTMRAAMQHPNEKIAVAEAISTAVYELSEHLKADAIVSATSSGFTARMVARFRPQVPIIAVAHDERIKRQLQLTWGVTPCTFIDQEFSAHKTILKAVRTGLQYNLLKETDVVIVTAGVDTAKQGSTNLIEVHSIKELLAYHDKPE
jgi:pyruvate kinase